MGGYDIHQALRDVWPDWQCMQLIGSGTYGDVYRVRRETDGELAAVKMILIGREQNDLLLQTNDLNVRQYALHHEQLVQECLGEIRMLSSMRQNPYAVNLQDFAVRKIPQDSRWLILIRMELLTPLTLGQHFTQEEVVRIGIDICEALLFCAQEHVLHRDVKPGNIFRTDDGRYKLGDFGISRVLDSVNAEMTLNRGTPLYMAPEAAVGGTYDYRADLYSLGLVLYTLLNENRMPFLPTDKQILSYRERLDAHERRMNGEALPPPLHADAEMWEILHRACAFRAEDRFRSAEAMKEALCRLRDGKTRTAARRKKWVLAAVFLALLLALAGAGAFFLAKTYPSTPEDPRISSSVSDPDDTGKPLLSRIAILSPPARRSYQRGDILDTTGLQIMAYYSDGRQEDVTEGIHLSQTELLVPGRQQICVSYGECQDSFEIIVTEVYITSLKILTMPEKQTYSVGESLETKGMTIGVTYSNGTSARIQSDFTCTPESFTEAGEIPVTVHYKGNTAEFPVTVFEPFTFSLSRDGKSYTITDCAPGVIHAIIPEKYNDLPVRVIGESAFAECKKLQSVQIPETVQIIETRAFQECTGLQAFHLPASVTLMGNFVLAGCKNITSLTADEKNEVFYSRDNCIIREVTKTLVLGCSTSRIPDDGSVTSIGQLAFMGMDTLTAVTIPDSVTEIHANAFTKTGIQSLHIPANVRFIDKELCTFTASLQEITVSPDNPWFYAEGNCLIRRKDKKLMAGCSTSIIPADGSVEIIGEGAFHGQRFSSIQLPPSIHSIERFSFATNIELKEFIIPEGVVTLAENTFSGCTALQKLHLPQSLRLVGNNAVANCPLLTYVSFAGTEEQWNNITILNNNPPLQDGVYYQANSAENAP